MESACKHGRNRGFTVHTRESTPGGQLGRYDKGNVGDRTSHCCSGHPRNQVSGWKHNGSAPWKWELSLIPEVEIVTKKKNPQANKQTKKTLAVRNLPRSDGQECTHQEDPLSHPNVNGQGLFKKVDLQLVLHYCFIYVIWIHHRIAEIPTSGSLVQERFPSQITLVVLIICKSQGTILYRYQIQKEC